MRGAQRLQGGYVGDYIVIIMENQMEKKMENEMETIIMGSLGTLRLCLVILP